MTRLPALDGWRGVAICVVLCCHIRWTNPAMQKLAPYGALGVHLFFALSGFLITTRLIEERETFGIVRWSNFFRRRSFRILPPALCYLAVVAVLGFVAGVIPLDWWQLQACLLFYRNYVVPPPAESWYTGHYWSLAVEEQFYLLWPMVLALVGFERGLRTAAGLAVATAVWRALDQHFGWVARAFPQFKGYALRTDYLLDGLLWGCVLAFLWRHAGVRRRLAHWGGSALCAGALAAIAALMYWTPPGYLALLPVCMALLPASTIAAPRSIAGRILESPPLVFTGRISYSLYLWQQLFLPWEGLPFAFGAAQQIPWNLVFSVAVAGASYRLIERPFIALGRRFEQRDSHAARHSVAQPGRPG